MRFDSDVVLLGTGVAPLITASQLLEQGKEVLILNPQRDFFLEDSELSLDPCLPGVGGELTAARLSRSLPEHTLEILRPYYPGALEFRAIQEPWLAAPERSEGFYDPLAPHVRARSRLFAASGEEFSRYEDFYVAASDAGLHPQLLEGIQVSRRFPGSSTVTEGLRGVLLPKTCDVDVVPYRNGILEFVRERIEPNRLLCGAGQVEVMPGGVRFHADGATHTARVREGVLVFWTPRMTSWILAQAKRSEVKPVLPAGIRYWEEWSLASRTPIDPGVVGVLGTHALWAEIEGKPGEGAIEENRLTVLRASKRLPACDSRGLIPLPSESWASADSFAALGELFQGFLMWDRFLVRTMRPRAILEWEASDWSISAREGHESNAPLVQVITRADGPLVDVVETAKRALGALS